MKTIRMYRLVNLSTGQFNRLKAAQMEAAHVWNECMQTHKQARLGQAIWPGEQDLRDLVKGRFALHSQSIQAIVRMFVTNKLPEHTTISNLHLTLLNKAGVEMKSIGDSTGVIASV